MLKRYVKAKGTHEDRGRRIGEVLRENILTILKMDLLLSVTYQKNLKASNTIFLPTVVMKV